MKRHTTIGGETLAAATQAHADARFLTMARDIAFTHHERFDGNGYPYGLCGSEIPLCGRVTAVADVYDALTTKRVYKPKFTHEHARSIIRDGAGTQFDPDVVKAFFLRESEIIRVAESLNQQLSVCSPSSETQATPSINRVARSLCGSAYRHSQLDPVCTGAGGSFAILRNQHDLLVQNSSANR